MIQLRTRHGRIDISLTAYPMGNDLCVILTGGDTPHLGAVSAASPDMQTKTVAFESHKEYHVTEMATSHLRESFDGNVAVCCGIHLDNIGKQEIADVMELAEQLVLELCAQLKNDNGKSA
jgi:hypothetical protein